MSDPVWNYADQANTIVWREWPDGRQESRLVSAPDIQAWIAEGNTPNPYVPPPTPAPERTPEEKLAALGLTADDLKALLGTPK